MFLFSRRMVPICALGLMLTACTTEPPPPGFTDADRALIRTTMEEALEISNTTGDFVQYGNLYYAADAVVMPPNGEAVRGREAIMEWNEAFPPYDDLRFTQVEVDGCGDIAYVYGTYAMVMTVPEGEQPVNDRGKYIEIWRRQADGSWKVALDVFNSDMPLPEG
jgi:ketosteroid isomerase-like protein